MNPKGQQNQTRPEQVNTIGNIDPGKPAAEVSQE